jgi:hypothetical protein
LAGAGQAGFAQENAQYASFGQDVNQISGEQQHAAYAYQQTAYSNGSTVEGQQYARKYFMNVYTIVNMIIRWILAEQQQQQQQQQGFEQQGNNFMQNVQYQSMPQFGVNA